MKPSAWLILALLVAPAQALAQGTPAPGRGAGDPAAAGGGGQTGDPVAQAQATFREAERLFRDGSYAPAAELYLEAYRLAPAPGLLYNAAQAARLAGDRARAIALYQRFLAEATADQAELARLAREHLDALERERAAAEAAEKDEVSRPPGNEAGDGSAAAGGASTSPRGGIALPPADAGSPSRAGDTPGRGLRVAGLAAAGAGLAALGVGIYFGLEASSIEAEIDDKPDGAAWPRDIEDRFEAGEGAERRMLVFTGVGAAAVLTGGVLYYLGWRAGQERGVHVSAGAGPGGPAVLVRGTF